MHTVEDVGAIEGLKTPILEEIATNLSYLYTRMKIGLINAFPKLNSRRAGYMDFFDNDFPDSKAFDSYVKEHPHQPLGRYIIRDGPDAGIVDTLHKGEGTCNDTLEFLV